MEPGLIIAAIVAIFGGWGAIWYRIGQLTNEVKQHNIMLTNIQRQLERKIITKEDQDG